MNYIKKIHLTRLKSKLNLLRMGLLYGLVLLFGIINFSCDKNSDADEYYVKYEANSSTIYYGGKLNLAISTENSNSMNITINTRTSWETVVGPVQKGFIATLMVNKEGSPDSHLQLSAKISVSKNGSPFALKMNDDSDTPRNSLQLSYKIDY